MRFPLKNILCLIAGTAFYTPAYSLSCAVYIPHSSININGYVLDLTAKIGTEFSELNYKPTSDSTYADCEFSFKSWVNEGTWFQKAMIQFQVKNLITDQLQTLPTASKTCLTQLCGISDFNQVALQELKFLKTLLPPCL